MANDKAFKIKNGLSAKRYLQSSTAVAASDVDMSLGSYFTKTLSANTTFTFSNPPASGTAGSFALEVTGGNAVVGYDLANASYDSKSFDTTATSNEANPPMGLAFNNDGTKMFVCSNGTDVVVEYDLSTAYDVSTSVYNSVSFSLSSTATTSRGLAFNNNGSKMYVVGNETDKIFEFDLSTNFDLSTASYNSVNFSVASQETNPRCVVFKPDGTKMFVVGTTGDDVNEYSLSTAYDISTASFVDSFSVASQDTNPTDVAFNADGTKMFMIGGINDKVFQYSLSTAYDVSTASYDSVEFSVASQDTSPASFEFSNDGTKMFVVGASGNDIHQYSTSASATATITYPASVKWSGATTPDAPAAGEKDVYVFVTTDGGTTYYAKQAGDAVA
jgi:6-phosphogluconolactonase (cycloisomerase 2 family)